MLSVPPVLFTVAETNKHQLKENKKGPGFKTGTFARNLLLIS